ncbi:lysozyme inhibitor LprI family protein [Ensifer sp. ZNC0028]|uniref:lysozyme inhibitor LprI family protein n=1 Tax=Ensifer sp. ZNC0028 TaxID=1339236 RepID=UPI0005BAF645|nr:lysozyme inhibitor LprI family protein [Ensifer sp. ZNC0028]
MRLRTLLLVAGLLATTGAARADECADASDQATMNACAGKALKASDAELNALYRQIQGRLKDDAEKTKLLVTAQRAWVAYRDAECDFASSGVAGGSAQPMITLECRDDRTKKRVADFKTYLSCEEGDLSCVLPPAN